MTRKDYVESRGVSFDPQTLSLRYGILTVEGVQWLSSPEHVQIVALVNRLLRTGK